MPAHSFDELKFDQWTPQETLDGERERRRKHQQAGDLFANKAQAALGRIVHEQGLIGEAYKRNREYWRDYGAALLGIRKSIGSDKSFGKRIKANNLDRAPANSPGIRSDAMWLAEHYEDVQKSLFTGVSKQEGLHRPNDIRTACRRAGYEWAGAKAKKDGTAKRTKPTPTPAGAKPGSTTARTATNAKQQPKRERDTVQAEAATLSAAEKARFDRLLGEAIARVNAQFDRRVEEQVKAQVEARVAKEARYHAEMAAKARAEALAYRARNKKLDEWMTEGEFKLVLGCLHPDHQPTDRAPRYNKAFQIFNRLKGHLNPDKGTRRAHSWDT